MDELLLTPRLCPHCGGKIDNFLRTVRWGGWVYDEKNYLLKSEHADFSILLTPAEGSIVSALLRAQGNVCEKTGILYSAICEGKLEQDWPEMKTVDVFVHKVRKKLEVFNCNLIETSWGRGYFAVSYTAEPVFNNRRKKNV